MSRGWVRLGAVLALALIVSLSGIPALQSVAATPGWTAMTSNNVEELRGVWGSSATDVFAVGSYDTILHYDGSTWSPMSSNTTAFHFHSVWGSSATDVFAVGNPVGSLNTIMHWDGNTWVPMLDSQSLLGTNYLTGVWGSSTSDVFAVGYGGTILHYDGNAWSEMTSGTKLALGGIWGSSATNVFAVGEHGTILHYDGNAWSAVGGGLTAGLLGAVWGSSGTDVFAAGGGSMLHYDGNAWSTMSSGSALGWSTAVWGSSGTDVFATESDSIFHYNGNAWSTMSSGLTSTLSCIWGSSAADVFAVGYAGTILHYDGTPLNQAPDQPSDVSPSNVAVDIGSTPTLQASVFSDPDSGDTHAATQWQVTSVSGDYSSPVYDSGRDIANLTQVTLPAQTLNSLTTYYWRVRYQDNHDAWSDWTSQTTFITTSITIDNTMDTTAPVISQQSVSKIRISRATVTWTTDEGSTSQVRYGLTTEYGSNSYLGTILVTYHEINLTDLEACKTYHYQVISKDAADNEAVSVDATFTTTAESGGGMPAWAWVLTTPGAIAVVGGAAYLVRSRVAKKRRVASSIP